ncbi:MAG TPA: carboxypeptidase regulatory-like domain-containing protein [Candidatus Eisenbacteria bacterium]|nr:carboxypeptidase regulatory-like domain-containing protein [Candidatus Eisenbacteria bacterium]
MIPRNLKAMLLLVLGAMSLISDGCAHSGSRVGGEGTSKTGTLRGKVMDENLRGIENVRVAISGTSEEQLTHADGSFLFARVPSGSYSVSARATGYVSTSRGGVLVDVGRVTFVELALKEVAVRMMRSQEVPADQAGVISGTVVDERDAPLMYAIAFDMNSTRAASTDAGGHFLLSNLPAGAYAIKVKLIGFATEIREGVQVVGRDTTKVVFKLKEQPVQMRIR